MHCAPIFSAPSSSDIHTTASQAFSLCWSQFFKSDKWLAWRVTMFTWPIFWSLACIVILLIILKSWWVGDGGLVYMTSSMCLAFIIILLICILTSWQVVGWWWRRPCLASGHVYALCDLSPPHPAVCLHTQFLWWLISVCCFSHSVWKRSWSPTAIDLNALILSIVCVGPCPEVILPMHAHCLSWIIATYSSPSRVLGTYL